MKKIVKPVEIVRLTIYCDACDHEFAGIPEEWHNRACPACGEPDIINDEDIAIHQSLLSTVDAFNEVFGEVPNSHSATLRVDSSKLKGKRND